MGRAGRLAFVAAACAGATVFACGSFSEGGPASSTDGGVEASGAETGAPDAAASDGSADPPFCKLPVIASFGATFDGSRTVASFSDDVGSGCSLDWSSAEGAGAPGALKASCEAGSGHAQIDRDVPLGGATRARLSFATSVSSIGDPSVDEAYVGCTLQLFSQGDGGEHWVALNVEVNANQLSFDQDSSAGGPTLDAVAVKAFAPGTWSKVRFEMMDITKASLTYRVFVDGIEIASPKPTIQLQGPPSRFRVKCGIDETATAATVLVDDVSFETCETP